MFGWVIVVLVCFGNSFKSLSCNCGNKCTDIKHMIEMFFFDRGYLELTRV